MNLKNNQVHFFWKALPLFLNNNGYILASNETLSVRYKDNLVRQKLRKFIDLKLKHRITTVNSNA